MVSRETADLKLGIKVVGMAFVVSNIQILGGRGNSGDLRVDRGKVFGQERGYR
jgi:hypothetical protein